jgi:hypothetical protein
MNGAGTSLERMNAMSSPAADLVDAMLSQLAVLFLAHTNGDAAAARQIATALMKSYQPKTETEVTLTADIIQFGCHATFSLMQASEPHLPLGMIIRLRALAVSLHRESLRTYEQLEQLRRERLALAEQAESEQAEPKQVLPEAAQPIQAADETASAPRPTVAEPVAPPSPSAPASTDSYAHLSKEAIRRLSPAQQKRIYLARMTETAKRRQAEQAALAAAQNSPGQAPE